MWWTFAAAALGSMTALLIAFVAYPWQKNRDRKLELQREKRLLYKALVHDLAALDDMTWGYEPIPEGHVSEQNKIALALHLYAPEPVIDAVYSELAARHDLMAAFSPSDDGLYQSSDVADLAEKLAEAQTALMRLLRYDLTGEQIDTSKMNNLSAILAFDAKLKIKV